MMNHDQSCSDQRIFEKEMFDAKCSKFFLEKNKKLIVDSLTFELSFFILRRESAVRNEGSKNSVNRTSQFVGKYALPFEDKSCYPNFDVPMAIKQIHKDNAIRLFSFLRENDNIIWDYFWFVTFPNIYGNFFLPESCRNASLLINAIFEINDIDHISYSVISFIFFNYEFCDNLMKCFYSHLSNECFSELNILVVNLKHQIDSMKYALNNSISKFKSEQICVLKRYINHPEIKRSNIAEKSFISLILIPLIRTWKNSPLFCVSNAFKPKSRNEFNSSVYHSSNDINKNEGKSEYENDVENLEKNNEHKKNEENGKIETLEDYFIGLLSSDLPELCNFFKTFFENIEKENEISINEKDSFIFDKKVMKKQKIVLTCLDLCILSCISPENNFDYPKYVNKLESGICILVNPNELIKTKAFKYKISYDIFKNKDNLSSRSFNISPVNSKAGENEGEKDHNGHTQNFDIENLSFNTPIKVQKKALSDILKNLSVDYYKIILYEKYNLHNTSKKNHNEPIFRLFCMIFSSVLFKWIKKYFIKSLIEEKKDLYDEPKKLFIEYSTKNGIKEKIEIMLQNRKLFSDSDGKLIIHEFMRFIAEINLEYKIKPKRPKRPHSIQRLVRLFNKFIFYGFIFSEEDNLNVSSPIEGECNLCEFIQPEECINNHLNLFNKHGLIPYIEQLLHCVSQYKEDEHVNFGEMLRISFALSLMMKAFIGNKHDGGFKSYLCSNQETYRKQFICAKIFAYVCDAIILEDAQNTLTVLFRCFRNLNIILKCYEKNHKVVQKLKWTIKGLNCFLLNHPLKNSQIK